MRTFLASLCLLALLAFAPSTFAQAGDTQALVGKPAPDFSLPTLAGPDAKLSDLKGNVVVLDFWATWCPPCVKSLPHLQKVHENKPWADQGLKVLAVNADEEKPVVDKFVQANKFTFAIPMDKGAKTLQAYRVQGIPTTVVVGRDGTIQNVFVGYGGEESDNAMKAAIEKALAAPKPAK